MKFYEIYEIYFNFLLHTHIYIRFNGWRIFEVSTTYKKGWSALKDARRECRIKKNEGGFPNSRVPRKTFGNSELPGQIGRFLRESRFLGLPSTFSRTRTRNKSRGQIARNGRWRTEEEADGNTRCRSQWKIILASGPFPSRVTKSLCVCLCRFDKIEIDNSSSRRVLSLDLSWRLHGSFRNS